MNWIGILGLVLGCQQPAGMGGKLDQMEKDMAELKASVDKLAQAVDDNMKKLKELADSHQQHMEKFHKGAAAAPAPVKKPVSKVK